MTELHTPIKFKIFCISGHALVIIRLAHGASLVLRNFLFFIITPGCPVDANKLRYENWSYFLIVSSISVWSFLTPWHIWGYCLLLFLVKVQLRFRLNGIFPPDVIRCTDITLRSAFSAPTHHTLISTWMNGRIKNRLVLKSLSGWVLVY